MRLQAERNQLLDLRQLSELQLADLRHGGPRFLHLTLDSLHYQLESLEPYVRVTLRLFNGTVFSLDMRDAQLGTQLGGHPVLGRPVLTSNAGWISPGFTGAFVFNQPLQPETTTMLGQAMTNHRKMSWTFRFSARCSVGSLADTVESTFSPEAVQLLHIPFGP